MAPEVYIEKLTLSPHRPRGALPRVSARLLDVMRDHGAVEPVVVRAMENDCYEILGNPEVWLAAQQLRLERVPVHIVEDLSDEEAADLVKAASHGFRADPIDEAEYLAAELTRIDPSGNRHRAIGKLAVLTGHQRPYISHALRLLTLPLAIQDMVRQAQLSAGAARALVGIPNRSAQLALAQKAVRDSLSVRAVEAAARELKAGKNPISVESTSETETKDADTQRLERMLSEQLGCAVRIEPDSGELVIRYHSMDVLDGILEKLHIDPL